RSRLRQPDQQLPTAASHVEEPSLAPNRLDQLMNRTLDVAAAPPKTMGRQREDAGDVKKRCGEQSDRGGRTPVGRHYDGKNGDASCQQPERDGTGRANPGRVNGTLDHRVCWFGPC